MSPGEEVDSGLACLFSVSFHFYDSTKTYMRPSKKLHCIDTMLSLWSPKCGFYFFLLLTVLGTLENIGFAANMSSMVLYFHIFFNISTSANILTNFLGSTFLLTIVGDFISYTYLSRLHTCLIFRFFEITVHLFSISSRSIRKLHRSLIFIGECSLFLSRPVLEENCLSLLFLLANASIQQMHWATQVYF